jgi:hypothetical protein
MVDSAAACVWGRIGIKPVKDAGRSQYRSVLASPRTPIRRSNPAGIRTCGVVESAIYYRGVAPAYA